VLVVTAGLSFRSEKITMTPMAHDEKIALRPLNTEAEDLSSMKFG